MDTPLGYGAKTRKSAGHRVVLRDPAVFAASLGERLAAIFRLAAARRSRPAFFGCAFFLVLPGCCFGAAVWTGAEGGTCLGPVRAPAAAGRCALPSHPELELGAIVAAEKALLPNVVVDEATPDLRVLAIRLDIGVPALS